MPLCFSHYLFFIINERCTDCVSTGEELSVRIILALIQVLFERDEAQGYLGVLPVKDPT